MAEALADRQARLIIDNAVDYAIVGLDAAGVITSWNVGASAIMGWSSDQAVGQPVAMFFTPEDVAAKIPAAEMSAALRHGRGIDERWHLKQDGTRFWANGEMMPLRSQGGELEGYVKILRDRTEQRGVAVALSESEERYRTLHDAIDEGFCLIEVRCDDAARPIDYRFREVNPAFERQTGIADAPGKWMRDLAPDHEQHWFDRYARIALTGEPARFALPAQALNGRWYEVFAYRVGEPSERLVAILFSDITERRSSEARLRANEEHLRKLNATLRAEEANLSLLLDTVTDGFYAVDRDGVTTTCNAAFLRMMGFTAAQDVIGRKLHDVIHHSHPDGSPYLAADCPIHRAASKGISGHVEKELFFPIDQEPVWLEYWTTPVIKDGMLEGAICTFQDITAREQAERERGEAEDRLRQSENRFRSMADHAPVMMWVTEPDGRCSYLNTRWYEFTGQRPGDGEDAGWFDAVHPTDRPAAELAFASANAEQRDFRVDFRLRRADGVYRWTIAAAAARLDADGTYLGYIGSIIDIDERRDAEEKLALNREQLRLATDIGEIGEWDVDQLTGTMFWPPRVKAMFGISPDVPVTLEDYYNGVHPDDRERTLAAYSATSNPAVRALYSVDYRTVGREDGVIRWVAAQGRGLFTPEGVCYRVIGTAIDITERKTNEIRLRELNERLEQEVTARTAERNRVWEMSRELLAIMDLDGCLKAVNPAWGAMLGLSTEKLLSSPLHEHVHSGDRPAVEAVMERLRRGETVERFEGRVCRTDGSWRWISWTFVPEGGTSYAVGRDVTAERDAAAELDRAQEALRQSQKMEAVGQLTGGLAHDFNNLLTGVTGSLELLQTRIAQGRIGDVDRYVTAAQGAAKRAAALTHRLLAFSRRQTLNPKPTDVNRLVAGMEELIRRTVGPEITVEPMVGAAGLWPTLVDPGQLENALLNLCINARDAMPDGGKITIETGNRWLDERTARERDLAPGQYVSMCVSDTGTGMPPDVIVKAFDPFFTTKPIGMGTGLGLSMIYGFAKQSGGQARIYSEVGQGTMVCIYLPRHLGDADAAEPAPELASAQRAEDGQTVLVVDDEPTVRMLIADVLEDLGYKAIEAADGAAGLKVLQSDARIDLLVTDVGLPGGMNGRQVADAARVARPGLKVLFITGYAENAVLSHGHLDPGMHVLTKPFAMDALANRIKSLISN